VEVVPLRAGHLHVAETPVDGDAVVDVYDVVVRLELGERGEEVRGARTAATPHVTPLAEDLRLGHEGEAIGREPRAARQLAGERQRAPSVARERLRRGGPGGGDADRVTREERDDPVALRFGRPDQHDADSLALPL